MLDVNGGKVLETAPGTFELTWAAGETLTVMNRGPYLDLSVALGSGQGAGSVQGLLGTDSSQATDFALPDGTVLPQPLSAATIMGAFASAWRVTAQSALLGPVPDDTVAPASAGAQAPEPMRFLATQAVVAAPAVAAAAAPAATAAALTTTGATVHASTIADAKTAGAVLTADLLPPSAGVPSAMPTPHPEQTASGAIAAASAAAVDPATLLHVLTV